MCTFQANQTESGSFVYYFPDFQAGFSPYTPVSQGAVFGVDGHYLGQQLYYPGPMFHHSMASPGFFPHPVAYGPEHFPAYVWDSPHVIANGIHSDGYGRESTMPAPKPNYSSQNDTITPIKASIPSKSPGFGKKGITAGFDFTQNAAIQSQLFTHTAKINNEPMKGFHPANKFHAYPSPGKSGLLYASTAGNVKVTGKTWLGTEKQKTRNLSQGTSEVDMLNEQNRGPRTNGNQDAFVNVNAATAGANSRKSSGALLASIRKEDYNLPDFPTKFDNAFFFIIKSYSEDDVHKSIKYNVWASTPNGNKRLDNAFHVAQEKMAEKGSKCPIFLFFSVNASGQFCGVAEMIGHVDFNKNMDFWQQDKWNGYFPVKWHIIKDIPNPQFRHIILENNENKPVTNSRDTQEIKFLQGTEMLTIFKNYSAKTSILDDFSFYESRQKAMQDRRIKPTLTKLEHLTLKTEAIAKNTNAADLEAISSGPQWADATGAHGVPDVKE
ncbi:Cleavage and polyadenylation specificity factor CPSF30 [Apostasia shenzhenica]|uniref:YTH domain-containing family protein n=1 Tax=Apostasia shenzhenica TaxID=1088818 RepID=A0A2I0AFX6_9ASPA|nr:Cleavage and polyadenylation specificity factor CPSF30 [Apostasia shenzhenica]